MKGLLEINNEADEVVEVFATDEMRTHTKRGKGTTLEGLSTNKENGDYVIDM